ncbi:5-methyltetrahydropteroyltriglutamate-homocysteine methyltransferase [Coniosporium apollinis CBS 100218]|uniref:5-methyltetrahydropteroyltriglutamate-homocysteine methyltransferase n=1 Tax=Coniosporium apollinis (strain CBS 100218) TaxID=1168221 RepID=R7YLY0_CONA1|nr:5-methyltetrahydropteroyltriglutamate-homocysteine methyltransferase [Coniosporium apollinis CBS 100218]EON62922.1 5-methyltetrahydropteroyltriglutamate-homocysteine methyltransferase [Coniosporium apollinis CBS 100218]
MVLPTGVYRADHVGSWLRPREVLDARSRVAQKEMSEEELRKFEDKHIENVVQKQIAAGLRSITDGEFRRAYFHLDFLKQLDGVEVKGSIKPTGEIKDGWAPPVLSVTGKLGHSKPVQVDDFKFLEAAIARNNAAGVTTKVAIPSPTMVHFRGGRASIDIASYPDLDAFFDDLAKVYQQELDDLCKAGCRFVQLDDTNLAYLCDPEMRKAAASRSEDLTTLPKRYAELINAAISKRPKDMTIAIHLCRGNYRSQWFASGGYEPVAEVLFKDLNVDAYFLEYDDARSGDFGPLKHLPEHKVVVLGLMSSKHSTLDDRDTIVKRLHEAASVCPTGLEQLCLSHQCGFSSTMEGNQLTEEEQWAKIRFEVEIAKSVWGEDLAA